MWALGLAAIRAYAERKGLAVDAYEFGPSGSPPQRLVAAYPALLSYQIVGLSFYNCNARTAFDFATALKHLHPDVLIVAGGPHASACPREVLAECPAIDIAATGEGEQIFVEIVRSRLAGQRVQVAGTAFRQGLDIVEPQDRPKISSLDDLPPPSLDFITDGPAAPLLFFDRSARRFRRAVPLVTSRSCPYRCSFCAIILIGRDWRRASAAKVRDDFEHLCERHGPFEHVYFMDANFFVNARRALEIAEGLAQTAARPTFSFSTRVNQVIRGRDDLAQLRELGLRAIELGVESASAAALERFAKDVTVEENDAALALLREHDIHVILDFIMFDAESTLADLEANLGFIFRNGLDTYLPWDHLQSYLTPYLGTPIRQHYQRALALELPLHDLPSPEGVIIDPVIRSLFVEIRQFFHRYPNLAAAVQKLERRFTKERRPKERGRLALNAVALRRLPFVLLDRLVSAARNGEVPTLDNVMPAFYRDDAAPATLGDVIAHALA